jgi:hypothetical protein
MSAAIGLSHATTTVQLYEDLSSRDLLQVMSELLHSLMKRARNTNFHTRVQNTRIVSFSGVASNAYWPLQQRRNTLANGDTVWELSEVTRAAVEGGLVVLDGLEQLRPGTLASLRRLLEDDEVDLPDGSLLVCPRRWELLLRHSTSERLGALRMRPTHPSFRVVALAVTPSKKTKWLTPAITAMFKFHQVPPLSRTELLQTLDGGAELLDCLLRFNESVSKLDDASLPPLSLRQLGRVCRRAKLYPEDLRSSLASCYLSAFLPLAARTVLDGVLDAVIAPPPPSAAASLAIETSDDMLRIGEVVAPRARPASMALVPSVVFHAVSQHVWQLRQLLKDWNAGEHLLLIGNQVIGVVRRCLQLGVA